MAIQKSLLLASCMALMGCTASPQTDSPMQENHSDSEHIDDSLLAESIAEANKRLPMDTGNNTRMERVSAGPGRKMTYHFTLTNRTSADISLETIALARTTMAQTACNSKSVRSFLRDGIAVTYAYKTADGADFAIVDVTDELCSTLVDN